jgi:hypothetical protein
MVLMVPFEGLTVLVSRGGKVPMRLDVPSASSESKSRAKN